MLACYISAHGFGHLAQCAPVLLALRELIPNVRLLIRSSLPESMVRDRLCDQNLAGYYTEHALIYIDVPVDVGVLQRTAVEEDWPATRVAVESFHADWDNKLAQESALLKKHAVRLVLSDIAPLGLAAAQQCGLPSIAMCSIDWFEIYSSHIHVDSAAMQQIKQAYAQSTLLLQLTPGMPMHLFPKRKKQGAVVRPQQEDIRSIRQQLNLPSTCAIALAMFGGSTSPPFDLPALEKMENWFFLMPAQSEGRALARNVYLFDARRFSTRDVMQLADVLITKPGYGTLTEAWATQTAVAYVARHGFAEYPYLKRWLEEHAPAALLPDDAFHSANWGPVLDRLYASSSSYALPIEDAIQAAAQSIADMLLPIPP